MSLTCFKYIVLLDFCQVLFKTFLSVFIVVMFKLKFYFLDTDRIS
nr:MAG TPA: hypothetical protein [Bacteriophage sp.]